MPALMRPLITLTTDFGPGSPYVAQMKGVILSICREVDLVDISHSIGPQNVREGAVFLADTTPRFPPDTIHLAVVDPGVGTSRRLIYAEIGRQRYLAPDNGLLSLLTAGDRPHCIRSLENATLWLPDVSHTFHGRDILAPVAAHLASGVDPDQVGPPLPEMLTLDWPRPLRVANELRGEVLYVDSFGNLITNVTRDDVALLGSPAEISVVCCGREFRGIQSTYGDTMPGRLIALFDSQGRLELARVQGSAARELKALPGEPVAIAARADGMVVPGGSSD